MVRKSASETDNDFKRQYAVSTVSLYIFVAVFAGRVTLNAQLAMGVFIIYQLWGLFWIKLILFSPNIYSIKIPTMIIDDWIPFSIPKAENIKIRKDRVVSSISALSGIRGAHMMVALRVMTATISILVLVAVQADLHHRGAVFGSVQSQQDMVPICLVINAIGMFCVGHFELNMLDDFHTKGHFLGVGLIFVGSLAIGFCMRWNILSVVLIALEFGICTFWVSYEARCVKKSDDISVVTRNSKMCIGIELVMFYVTNAILTSTVYACGANEGNIFASPWK